MALSHGSLPFKEQIDYFRGKVDLPTRSWTDAYAAEHDYAFVVAGAVKRDLLVDLRGAVESPFPTARPWNSSAKTLTGWWANMAGNTRASAVGVPTLSGKPTCASRTTQGAKRRWQTRNCASAALRGIPSWRQRPSTANALVLERHHTAAR